jgi:hypothetical protein
MLNAIKGQQKEIEQLKGQIQKLVLVHKPAQLHTDRKPYRNEGRQHRR